MRPRELGLALLLALGACSDGSDSSDPLLNRCEPTLSCPGGTSCDPDLGICVQPRATIPYDFRVQVTPTEVPDGGRLAITTTPRLTLGDAGALPPITAARAVSVRGSVRAADGTALEAELVFTPQDDSALGGARSVFTQPGSGGQAFLVQLQPSRTYEVVVYPRGPDSAAYPPFTFELTTAAGDQNQDFTYPALVSLSGQVLDENDAAAPRGLRIKTRFRDSSLASSSLGALGDAGTFAINVPQAVLDAPAEHELALDLSEVVAPQEVQIAFDLSKGRPDGKWVMPVLPSPVRFACSVYDSERRDMPSVDAQLSFISDFALPAGDNDQGQADWCRLRLPGAAKDTFRCSAYVRTHVGDDLQVAVELLPGQYQIAIVPAVDRQDVRRLATKFDQILIQRQPDGMQGPTAYGVASAPQFLSTVRSPDNRPMPGVVVSAHGLGVQGDLPAVALYNRSDRQTSQASGRATLSIDVGIYDLVAAPPAGSGYAWVLAFNRRIAGASPDNQFPVLPQLPVVLRGAAFTANRAPVAEADVDAYALVPDLEGGPDRAVRIAHATTDRAGNFLLQMPPRIGLDDPLGDGGVVDAGVVDAGVVTDAGLDAQRPLR